MVGGGLRLASRSFTRFLAAAVLRQKRFDSLPVSRMWLWRVWRSSKNPSGKLLERSLRLAHEGGAFAIG